MKMRNLARRCAALLLAAVLLCLTACSGGTTAATMHLRRTEGTVAVSDGDGKDIPVLNNLGLYSGYGVGTRLASYAWIDLDDVKLAKLDQNSEISIRKDGKALDIEVKSGSLFFDVTQPLEDDETMEIRTSNMLIGIRGTSGWVEDNGGLSRVYLLEGKVECSAGEQTVQVKAGEFAELTPDGELTVREFDEQDAPAFVQEELVSSGLAGDRLASGEAGENVTWTYYSSGVLTIEGTGNMDDHEISTTQHKDTVPWSYFREDIHTVIISNGITGIGDFAFADCGSLTGVIISHSVTSIGKDAFAWCTSLTSVTIPNSVTSIGDYAFVVCSGLTSVDIPDSVTSIGEYAFGICSSLAGVDIPDSVTTIGDSAFDRCSSLTSVTIGGSVTSIGAAAFAGCINLTDLTIGSSVTSIGNCAFEGCGMTSVTIPDGVTSIEGYAFEGCENLTGVTIPASVASIGDGSFSNCGNLADVYYGGSESQWNQIELGDNNDFLLNAAIHYDSTGN